MATVDKNFKVKHGLIVEGTTATVNGDNIVTENAAQTLTNKEFTGETKFHAANGAGRFSINLDGTTGATTLTGNNSDLTITTNGGDIVLNPDGSAYIGSNSTNNRIATIGDISSLSGVIHTGDNASLASLDLTQNGQGQNLQIGDDAYIGDVNLGNTINILGIEDSASGYVSFGQNGSLIDNTAQKKNYIGSNGTDLSLGSSNDVILLPTSGYAYIGTALVDGSNRIATRAYVDSQVGADVPITSVDANFTIDGSKQLHLANTVHVDTRINLGGSANDSDGRLEFYNTVDTSVGRLGLDTASDFYINAPQGNLNIYADNNIVTNATILANSNIKTDWMLGLNSNLYLASSNETSWLTLNNDGNIYANAAVLDLTGNNSEVHLSKSEYWTNGTQYGIIAHNGNTFKQVATAGDFQVESNNGQINLYANSNVNIESNNGNIVLYPDGNAYVGGTSSNNVIVQRGVLDSLVGDNTVDGSTGNTIKDRIDSAKSAAETFASGLASNYDAAGAASTAQTNAESYTDTKLADYTKTSSLDSTVGGYGYIKTAALSGLATETYVNTAVATKAAINDATTATTTTWSSSKINTEITTAVGNVVGLAPDALNTLQELAAAFNNQPDTLQNLITTVGGKQDALTAGDGISLGTGATVSVIHDSSLAIDGLTKAVKVNLGTNSGLAVTDGLVVDTDVIASVDYVSTNYVNVANLPGQLSDYILNTAKGQANGVATLDGNAQVPLNQLGNVPAALITSVGSNLDVINGELVINNDPGFTEVNINSVAKQFAATANLTANSSATVYSFNLNDYHSAKATLKVESGTDSEVSEILLTLDSSNNIAITEYGIVGTNGSMSTISASVSGNIVSITVVPTYNGNATITGMLLA